MDGRSNALQSQKPMRGGFALRMLPMMLTLVALPILLAGCQTTGSGATSVCSQWRSITWSSRDTPQTIDGVKGNNARRGAWCMGQ